jgi:hypothetical protein
MGKSSKLEQLNNVFVSSAAELNQSPFLVFYDLGFVFGCREVEKFSGKTLFIPELGLEDALTSLDFKLNI